MNLGAFQGADTFISCDASINKERSFRRESIGCLRRGKILRRKRLGFSDIDKETPGVIDPMLINIRSTADDHMSRGNDGRYGTVLTCGMMAGKSELVLLQVAGCRLIKGVNQSSSLHKNRTCTIN